MKAWHIVSEVLRHVAESAKVGTTGVEMNRIAHDMIVGYGASPFNVGYKPSWAESPFPSALCVNINFMIAHGIPSEYKFQNGDIVNFDTSLVDSEGNCADAALTVPIGDCLPKADRIIRYAKRVLYDAIYGIKAGVTNTDVTMAIYRSARKHDLRISRTLSGHGIGKKMHELPTIANHPASGIPEQELMEGQIICIEPLVTLGNDEVGARAPDGWGIFATDGELCAMFEHMILVKKDGCEILTTHIAKD